MTNNQPASRLFAAALALALSAVMMATAIVPAQQTPVSAAGILI